MNSVRLLSGNKHDLTDYRKNQVRSILFLMLLTALLLVSVLLSLRAGSYNTPTAELIKGIFGKSADKKVNLVIRNNRLPRICTAIVAGAGLGLAGCILQAILHNPLASASTLGVSQGATFGAAFAIVTLNLTGGVAISLWSFLGSIAVAAVILGLSRLKQVSAEGIVLAGVAISSMLGGATTLIQYFANEIQLSNLVFWTFGDLGSTDWNDLRGMALMVLVLIVYCTLHRWDYNALLNGEETAVSLGINVQQLTLTNMVLCCLTCSMIVSRVGLINFIGLVAPHIVRMVVGNNHVYLIPGSVLAGATLLLLGDLFARVAIMPIILPIGAITSFLGGPLFLYLLFKGGQGEMIEVNHISYHYHGGGEVLKDVSFQLEPGKFLAILGNNGVGKSTLLKCLNKILKADDGTFLLDGENILKMNNHQVSQRIAFVSQNVPSTQMTVHDVVMLGRRPYMKWGFTEKDHQIVHEAMDRLNLDALRGRFLNQLSGGERQKVMLARALAQQPKLLLLDEPTSSLDIHNQYQVLKIVQEICRKDGLTAIVVIHDLNLALRFCDRFLLLRQGQVYDAGDWRVLTPEALEQVYQVKGKVLDVEGRKMVLVEE